MTKTLEGKALESQSMVEGCLHFSAIGLTRSTAKKHINRYLALEEEDLAVLNMPAMIIALDKMA